MRLLLRRLTGDGVKFFRDLMVLAGGQVLSKLLGFAAFAWLARVLDPLSYGAVEYVVGLSVFFAIVVDGGLGVIGTRRSARDPGQLELLAFQIPTARLLLTVLSMPIMIVVALHTQHVAASPALVGLFALSLLTTPWRQQWLFQATGRMATVANADIVRMAVFTAIICAAVRSPGDVVWVGWAEVAAVTGMTLYCVIVQHRRVTPMRLTGSLSGFGALMREGAAVGSSNFVWALGQTAPLFLVSALAGGVATAWFAGAARITGSIVQFSNLYHFNLYPAVSRAHADGDGTLKVLLRRSLRLTAWGGIFVALILTVFAFPIIRLTLGPKLRDAAPVLQVLAWTIPVALWSGHARWALAAAGAQHYVLFAQVAGLVVTTVVGVLAGQSWGASGYALGALAGAIAVWVAAHCLAVTKGCDPPSIGPILIPLVLAGIVIVAVGSFAFGPWQVAAAVVAFVVAAPLFDRALFTDIRSLAGINRLPLDGAVAA